MTFISYAQNSEDVLLWRALNDVPNGFYIDVGANDPVADSVTCAFYERGWRGINIEPVKSHFDDLCAQRPRDVNLQLAAGEHEGVLELWEFETRGWATACASSAQQLMAQGHPCTHYQVAASPLADICHTHVQGPIHFLKIDVEGFEASVLAGMDFERFRPWVLLIETEPAAGAQRSAPRWEAMLLAAGYQCVFDDGLNRYYLAQEHVERSVHFRTPPGVLDNFQRYETVQWQVKAEGLHADLLAAREQYELVYQRYEALHDRYVEAVESVKRLEASLAEVNHQRHLAEQACHALGHEIGRYQASLSWRITAPLRQLNAWLKRLRLPAPVPEVETLLPLTEGSSLPKVVQDSHRFNRAVWPVQPQLRAVSQVNSDQGVWVRMVGHIEGHYSLSIVNRCLAKALDLLNDQRLLFVPYHGGPYQESPRLDDADQPVFNPIFQRESAPVEGGEVVSLVHHYPFMSDPRPAFCKTTLFFWEESTLSAETLAHLNQFDVVFVASSFVSSVLVNAGCSAQIVQIPLGVDHLPMHSITDAPRVTKAKFRFLHVSSAFERKGVDCLLRAYFDSFTAADSVELFIKTFPNPHNHVREWLVELQQCYSSAPSVIIDESSMGVDEMVALMRSADAMVLPSRGEGFNLPAAEAMALGVPVITTGYSGHLDFCTLSTAELVEFCVAPSRSHLQTQESYWAEPDVADLGRVMQHTMRRLQENDPALLHKVSSAKAYIQTHYTWQQAATGVLSAIDQWRCQKETTDTQVDAVRLDVISPYDSSCGIAEYTRSLLGSMFQHEHYSLRIWCDTRTDSSRSVAHPAWTMGVDDSVVLLLDRLLLDVPDVLLVQHQPSLFTLSDDVCERLAALSQAGCIVVLELHSTRPLLHECALTDVAVGYLRQLSRVIVHQVDDINSVLEIGLLHNVMLMGLGAIEPLAAGDWRAEKKDLSIPSDALVLGCFGFALPHKGLDSLIEAVVPLEQALQRPVHLLMVNAVRDVAASELIASYQQLAASLGVSEQVIWRTDFLPVESAQSLLNASDYMLFPYKNTKESASAAVTLGIAVERPVLVSPLAIFSDLEGVVHRMDGCDSQAIVKGVLALERDEHQKAAVLSAQHEWLEQRGWSKVSHRFAQVIEALRRVQKSQKSVGSAPVLPDIPIQKQLFVDVTVIHAADAKTGIQRTIRKVLAGLYDYESAWLTVCPVRFDGEHYVYCAAFASTACRANYAEGDPLKFNPGDCFLGLDLTAHLFPDIIPYLQHMRRSGVSLFYYVYDILPLSWPAFFDEGLRSAFRQWVVDVAEVADGLICISAFTADELSGYLRLQERPIADEKLHVVHIGADFMASSSDQQAVEELPEALETLTSLLASHPSVLMVGTVEPRKGHEQVLTAFECLWAKGEEPILVIVGKAGWLNDHMIQRLRHHHQAGRRLFWFEGVDDHALAYLYRHCGCLMAASYVEGFGLPLIEAAQAGLPLLVRDIPVFREVAGDYANYFSADDAEALAETLSGWWPLLESGEIVKSQGMPFLTWQNSVEQLCQVLGIKQTERVVADE